MTIAVGESGPHHKCLIPLVGSPKAQTVTSGKHLVRLNLKRQHGTRFPHHLQEGQKGSGAMYFGWQLKPSTLAVQPLAAEASSRDVEHDLSDGEGAAAGAQGWEVPTRFSWHHLEAWQGLWSQLSHPL